MIAKEMKVAAAAAKVLAEAKAELAGRNTVAAVQISAMLSLSEKFRRGGADSVRAQLKFYVV